MRTKRAVALASVVIGSLLVCLLGGLAVALRGDLPRRVGAMAAIPAVPPLVLPPAGQPAPDVEWDRIPDLGKGLPQSLLAYRLLRGPTGVERVRELADAFAVSGEPGCKPFLDGETCYAADDTSSVHVDQDGRFGFSSLAILRTDASGVAPCTDDEAVAFVTTFLDRNGFLPSGGEFGLRRVGELGTSGVYNDDGTWGSVEYGKVVAFGRTLGGLPVYGVSRIVMGIDRLEGELRPVWLTSAWHPIEPYAELPLRSIDDAYADVVAGNFDADMTKGGKAVVENVTLAYYEPPIIYEQPFLQPVYVFSGTVTGASQSAQFSFLVPAIAESAIVYPTPTAIPVAAPAIVPTGPIQSARVRRGGEWTELSEAEAQAILAAAALPLQGSLDALGIGEKPGLGLREARRMEDWRLARVWVEGVVDIVYAEPVEFAVTFATMPWTRHYLPLDDAGRTRVVAQRLMVTVESQGTTLVFACLPKPGEDGQALTFQLQWPGEPDELALAAVRQLIMGEAMTTQ